MNHLLKTLWAYWRTSRMSFASSLELELHQSRHLKEHLAWLAQASPYFAPYAGKPLHQWPRMDKAVMMDNFDQMNTAGLRLADVFDVALRSEKDRNFAPMLNGYTVGLSSGTSARRGVFVASPAERAAWAGIILAKALPRGLFAGERVALFLRANSSLYTAIESRWLTFRFFDLFASFDSHYEGLCKYNPTVLVAPAQVLRQLALAKLAGKLPGVQPVKVISAAEVLELADRQLVVQAFGAVHELYQATEGFLASTCAYGTLHLNEEFIHIEPEWLDAKRERFVPVITDFTRVTQPIIRYRLNDVLVRRSGQCPCGSHSMALHAIEGRCDDMLELPGLTGGTVHAFADVVSRALAQALPVEADYSLVQTSPTELMLTAPVSTAQLTSVLAHLEEAFRALLVDVRKLTWTLKAGEPVSNQTAKRRRIRREFV